MKALLAAVLTPLAMAFTFCTSLRADIVMVQQVEGGGQAGEMTMKIKDNKILTALNPQVSMVIDASSGDATTIMHGQRKYLTVPASTTKALMAQMQSNLAATDAAASSPGAATKAKLQSTGKKEKISGYDTEEYVWNTGNLRASFWIARDVPQWRQVLDGMMKFQSSGLAAMTKGMMPAAADFPGIPVRTETTLNGQKVTYTLVSISDETLDPAQFEIPSGYTEIKMPSFNPQPSPEPEPEPDAESEPARQQP